MNEQQRQARRQAQIDTCVMLLKTSWWNLPLQAIDPATDEFYTLLEIPQTAASLDAVRIPAQALRRYYEDLSYRQVCLAAINRAAHILEVARWDYPGDTYE